MNAPFRHDDVVTPRSSPTKTPADLDIVPRDRRFGRDEDFRQERWWLGGDPIASAFHNALSVTFPKGEAFFIESVKAFRDGVPPKLEREIRAFTMQEVMHSREHLAFNTRVTDAGYDISKLEADVDESMDMVRQRAPVVNLTATMALEHYTAMMAVEMLREDARQFEGADPQLKAMWTWHAIEEIEHKGVAYDVWLHATRDWPRFRRWRLKTLMMLLITKHFWQKRIEGTLDLLRQDGLTGWRVKAKLFWYLFGKPGIVRRLVPQWLAFFMPGFHPWNHDDRALIELAESDYVDAVMPTAPAPAA